MAIVNPVRTDGVINPKQEVLYTYGTLQVADTGSAIYIGDLEQVTVQLTSGGAATAQVRVSNDGVTFFGLSATLTGAATAVMAVGIQRLDVPARFLDINPIAGAVATGIFVSGKRRGS